MVFGVAAPARVLHHILHLGMHLEARFGTSGFEPRAVPVSRASFVVSYYIL